MGAQDHRVGPAAGEPRTGPALRFSRGRRHRHRGGARSPRRARSGCEQTLASRSDSDGQQEASATARPCTRGAGTGRSGSPSWTADADRLGAGAKCELSSCRGERSGNRGGRRRRGDTVGAACGARGVLALLQEGAPTHHLPLPLALCSVHSVHRAAKSCPPQGMREGRCPAKACRASPRGKQAQAGTVPSSDVFACDWPCRFRPEGGEQGRG